MREENRWFNRQLAATTHGSLSVSESLPESLVATESSQTSQGTREPRFYAQSKTTPRSQRPFGLDGAEDEEEQLLPSQTRRRNNEPQGAANQQQRRQTQNSNHHVKSPIIPVGQEPTLLAEALQPFYNADSKRKRNSELPPPAEIAPIEIDQTRVLAIRTKYRFFATVHNGGDFCIRPIRRYTFVQKNREGGHLVWRRLWKDGPGAARSKGERLTVPRTSALLDRGGATM